MITKKMLLLCGKDKFIKSHINMKLIIFIWLLWLVYLSKFYEQILMFTKIHRKNF